MALEKHKTERYPYFVEINDAKEQVNAIPVTQGILILNLLKSQQ
jgi:hypothetical protein